MIAWVFGLGFLLYCVQVWGFYNEALKNTNWYYPAIIIPTIINIVLFSMLAKRAGADAVYLYGRYWDLMTCGLYLLLPILFFGVKLNSTGLVGLGLIIIGTLVIHFGS